MNDRAFHVAKEEEVIRGDVTDVYFIRTLETIKKAGLEDVRVRAEFHVMGLPQGYSWGLFTGLAEVIELIKRANLRVNVYSMREGTIFLPKEPLLVIEGRYVDFAAYETPILGILRHYSSISTKAARVKSLIMDKQCLFFGARALHPSIQPMADRAAYIGGCDGVAGTLGAELIGIQASGTMPHALMIIFKHAMGDHSLAWKYFDEAVPSDVPRIVLADTFLDEREEAAKAIEVLGNKLAGVRLDTPGSRRGNMRDIVNEVKWSMKAMGHDIKVIVSGGLDEASIASLRDSADSFGVGTSIAFPPSIDVSMDIVEAFDEEKGKWVPITKRGKLPGFKQVHRCPGFRDTVTRWGHSIQCSDGSPTQLIEKVVDDGKPLLEESDADIRARVLKQLVELSGKEPSVVFNY